jgi:hypothetical protein
MWNAFDIIKLLKYIRPSCMFENFANGFFDSVQYAWCGTEKNLMQTGEHGSMGDF